MERENCENQSSENKVIRERLQALRTAMRGAGIDFYLIPTGDFHHSEYVGGYFKVREYFCGFSGSNGTLLVWQDGAGLWTDGRYFIQAQHELAGTGVSLFRMMEDGVPTIPAFLQQNMKEGQTLGFDGRVICAAEGLELEERLLRGPESRKCRNGSGASQEAAASCGKGGSGAVGIRMEYGRDLAGELWRDRPAPPAGKITILPLEYAGAGVAEKLARVREKLSEQGAGSMLLTKLDDLMWLFNIRGCDVSCNPVAMCYAYLTQTRAALFLQKEALEPAVERYFEEQGIEVLEYDGIAEYLKRLPVCDDGILVDTRHCNYLLYQILRDEHKLTGNAATEHDLIRHTLIEKDSPAELLKAVKNPVELGHMEAVFLQDSVAVTRFIHWLKTNVGRAEMEITEVSAADKLEEFRRQIPGFLGLSFPTIAGFGANAAIVHYEAAKESGAVLRPEGMLLVDSGGQYMGGTTDVTRTIALGPLSEEERYHYTRVVMANLRLSRARFLYGCTGRNLDILARQPLWDIGLDYKHGTGHGVGYMLNVHEGPQNMHWRYSEKRKEAVLEEGMLVSNEPGIYIEGSHGIRLENIMAVKKDAKNEYGQFMHFETLTWVPFDLDAVNEQAMPVEDWMFLLSYQRQVYEKIAPFLGGEERAWLKKETRAGGTALLR